MRILMICLRNASICFFAVCALIPAFGAGAAPSAGMSFASAHSLGDSLSSDDFIYLYGQLDNFFFRLKNESEVSVAFLGGSITAGNGWRDRVMQFLERKYPGK